MSADCPARYVVHGALEYVELCPVRDYARRHRLPPACHPCAVGSGRMRAPEDCPLRHGGLLLVAEEEP